MKNKIELLRILKFVLSVFIIFISLFYLKVTATLQCPIVDSFYPPFSQNNYYSPFAIFFDLITSDLFSYSCYVLVLLYYTKSTFAKKSQCCSSKVDSQNSNPFHVALIFIIFFYFFLHFSLDTSSGTATANLSLPKCFFKSI